MGVKKGERGGVRLEVGELLGGLDGLVFLAMDASAVEHDGDDVCVLRGSCGLSCVDFFDIFEDVDHGDFVTGLVFGAIDACGPDFEWEGLAIDDVEVEGLKELLFVGEGDDFFE